MRFDARDRHRLPGAAPGQPGRRPRRFVWSGRRFRTTAAELERLWAMLPAGTDADEVMVVMEPTRNAWVPLAAWFRRRGATVVLVPPERSADLRAYYAKHTKTDRLDSRMLARLPLLHPDGLHPEQGLGPGRPAASGDQAALHAGQAPHHAGPARRAAGDPRPGWQPRSAATLANKHPAAVPRRRLRRPAHRCAGSAGPGWPGSATGTPAAPGARTRPTELLAVGRRDRAAVGR